MDSGSPSIVGLLSTQNKKTRMENLHTDFDKCRPEDLNPQPTDYKSVALPIELGRHIFICFLDKVMRLCLFLF